MCLHVTRTIRYSKIHRSKGYLELHVCFIHERERAFILRKDRQNPSADGKIRILAGESSM